MTSDDRFSWGPDDTTDVSERDLNTAFNAVSTRAAQIVRRRRIAVASATSVAVLVVTFIAGSAWNSQRNQRTDIAKPSTTVSGNSSTSTTNAKSSITVALPPAFTDDQYLVLQNINPKPADPPTMRVAIFSKTGQLVRVVAKDIPEFDQGITVTRDRRTAYLSGFTANGCFSAEPTQLDLVSGKMTRVGTDYALNAVTSADGKYLTYESFADQGCEGSQGSIKVLDLSNGTTQTYGFALSTFGFDSNNSSILAATYDSNQLSILDLTTGKTRDVKLANWGNNCSINAAQYVNDSTALVAYSCPVPNVDKPLGMLETVDLSSGKTLKTFGFSNVAIESITSLNKCAGRNSFFVSTDRSEFVNFATFEFSENSSATKIADGASGVC